MRARGAVALVPLLVACGAAAACSAGADPGPPASTALSCGMVVDPDTTGYFGGPLTAGRAVAMLAGLDRGEGKASIAKGRMTGTGRGTLDVMAVELLGYSGNQLSDDAAAFARAELSYSPYGLPLDTAYAGSLQSGIGALERDCPSGRAPGAGRPASGH